MEIDLEKRFTYRPPKAYQPEKYEVMWAASKSLAELFVKATPTSREQSLALTKLEEAVFWANAAIARSE